MSDLKEGDKVMVKRNVPDALKSYIGKIGVISQMLKQYNVAEIDYGDFRKRIAINLLIKVK